MISNPSDGASKKNLPLFSAGQSSGFFYRISYKTRSNIIKSLQYNSVHELILNLYCFENGDTITYILKEDGSDYITITVDEFKITVANTLYITTDGNVHARLEWLYLRLLLTNHHSLSIPDKGRFRQLDYTLRSYMTTIRGGIDCYITYQSNHKVALFMKYRRYSSIHLLSKVVEWNDDHQNDISINHINAPSEIRDQPMFQEALKLYLRKDQFRLYYYDPIPGAENDKIIPTEPAITSAIIKVINQLLK